MASCISGGIGIHLKKAFGELYSMVMVGGCELKYTEVTPLSNFSRTNFN